MSPKARRRVAAVIVVVSVVAWPVTSLTIFRSEPQGILGLSWLSLIFAAVQILVTTDVRKQQDDD